jgi:general secretion pathway protein B
MSYILDALKKLEHEKSRKSRGDGMINISGALFENERARPSGPAGWKIALAVTIAVLVTFAATWLLLSTGKARENPVPRLAAPVPAASPAPQVTVVTVPLPPVPPVVSVQQTPAAASSAPAPAAPVRVPGNLSKPQEAVGQSEPSSDDDEDRASRRRAGGRKGPVVPADQAVAAPADIKLSGIAWQEERHARRAVVNGFLMKEGGVVSGARITAIYQNRVRFSLSGKTFDIPLISTDVPAAGK